MLGVKNREGALCRPGKPALSASGTRYPKQKAAQFASQDCASSVMDADQEADAEPSRHVMDDRRRIEALEQAHTQHNERFRG